MKRTSTRECLDLVSLWACLWGVVLHILIDVGGPSLKVGLGPGLCKNREVKLSASMHASLLSLIWTLGMTSWFLLP